MSARFVMHEAFDRKVAELQGILGCTTEYVPHDISRNDPWIHGKYGLMRKDGAFFKDLFIRAIRKAGEKVNEWVQPITVREHNQYDSFACHRIVGDIVLPVRMREIDDVPTLEYGLTALQGPGSFGEITFSAPRASMSNPEELPVKVLMKRLKDEKAHEEYEPETSPDGRIYRRLVRSDVNRLCGRDRIWLSVGDESKWKKCVWFTAGELELILRHEQMTDSPTRELVYYALMNSDKVLRFFRKKPLADNEPTVANAA